MQEFACDVGRQIADSYSSLARFNMSYVYANYTNALYGFKAQIHSM